MAETILAVFGVLIVCLLLASPVLAIMALVRSGTLRAALDRTNARLESLEARLADEPSTVSGPPRPDSTEDASEADEARSASSGWESETDPAHVGGWSLPGADSLAAPGDAAGGIERKLTSRWLVWLGGVTVALAGIFLVKYSIDQDWLGPSVRCALGVLAGVALTAAGEWCRRRFLRRATDLPEPGVIPPALGAAGIATLYSSVYAAFALYDLIGALLAFVALAVISFFSFALALLHGRFIAVLGLIGGYLIPVLVSTGEGSSLALFSFLGALVAALTVIVRYRGWWVVAWLGLAGAAAWPALWFATRWNPADAPVLGVYLVALAALFLYVRPVVGTERSFKLGLLVRQADAFLWASAVAIATLIFVLVRVDGYAPVSLAFLAVASALFLHAGYRAERYDLLGALALVPVLASFATWDIPGLLDSAGRAIGEHGWLYDLGRGPVVPPLLVPYASLSAAFAALFGLAGLLAVWRTRRPWVWAAVSAAAPVAWLVYAGVLLALGIRRASSALRYASLALVLLTTAKLFVFDMAELAGLVRVASFLGLGLRSSASGICTSATSSRSGRLQRIPGGQIREAAEVPVGCPEFGDSMRDAQRRNPGVMHHRPLHPTVSKQLLQHRPMLAGLGEQLGDGRFEPGIDLVQRLGDRRRRVIDPRMAHDREKLVNARPWQPPGDAPLRQ